MIENYRQLSAHDGPYFEHWRRRCLAAFGVTTIDEPLDDEEGARSDADRD